MSEERLYRSIRTPPDSLTLITDIDILIDLTKEEIIENYKRALCNLERGTLEKKLDALYFLDDFDEQNLNMDHQLQDAKLLAFIVVLELIYIEKQIDQPDFTDYFFNMLKKEIQKRKNLDPKILCQLLQTILISSHRNID